MILLRTIAVDFDGVIHAYSKGWADGSIYDVPKTGTGEAIRLLRENGFQIILYSVRACDRLVDGQLQPNQLAEIQAWLSRYNIEVDSIWTSPGKPFAQIYVDANALRFVNWSTTLGAILEAYDLDDSCIIRPRKTE